MVDLPIDSMVDLSIVMLVYQRVAAILYLHYSCPHLLNLLRER